MDTVFLAFANSDTDKLHTLSEEDEKVYGVLSNYKASGAIDLIREQYATTNRLIETFRNFQDKLSVFLYSGHAGRDQLMLQDQNANAEGVAALLKRCPNIKLVILNGCSTAGQVNQLLNNGVPIVIATSSPVEDKSATQFSINFFTALAERKKTIEQAYKDGLAAAKVVTTSSINATRDISFASAVQSQPLWGIFYKEENQALLNWKLGVIEESPNSHAIYNQYLTRQVIESIKTKKIAAENFCNKVDKWEISNNSRWETVDRICVRAKEIIAFSFVGVIGIQLSKLMAIGSEENSENKKRKYIKKCIFIAERSLDLINFALLSKLWDCQKKEKIHFSTSQLQKLENYFNAAFEISASDKFDLLKSLYPAFESNKIDFPISELSNLKEQMNDQGEMSQIFQVLDQLRQAVDKGEFTRKESAEAERQLAVFLKHVSFLVNYRMASIKRIGYNQVRNTEPRFLHRFAALGIDSKANVDAEKVVYTPQTVHTNSVLLYKGDDYQESINLFPFVIDYNALTFEHGARICFYRSNDITDSSLEYLFLEDSTEINIDFKGIAKKGVDFNELMMNDEKRIIHNLDNVVNAFRNAHSSFITKEINFDNF